MYRDVYCSICSKKMDEFDEGIYLGNAEYACSDCIEEYYDKCYSCGKYFRKDELMGAADGKWYCSICFKDVAGEEEEEDILAVSNQADEKSLLETTVNERMRGEFLRQINEKKAVLDDIGLKKAKLQKETELLEEMLGKL